MAEKNGPSPEVYPPYLEILNSEQRRAVLHSGSPLLILAGAGSGKTRVITTKIAYLIREAGFAPESILAVTFTNKAAREMAERAQLIESRAANAMLRTFHSFGAWFLRRNGAQLGLNSKFTIYDDDDTVALLSSIAEDTPRAELKRTAHLIARAKDYFLSPGDAELEIIDHRPEFRAIYTRYEQRLEQIGNVDFGDLIKKPVEILRSVPEVARRFHDRFKVIMVDEYQDSNVAQFALLKELAAPETYVCVVGDDDQSIYRFRGAEVRNILEFPERFPGTEIIRLEQNYRSTSPILDVASSVVDHNEGRLGKKLRAVRGTGKTPVLAYLPNQDQELEFCAELIEKSLGSASPGEKARYSDWAILYRMNAQSLGFETEFLRRRIPYRVVGSLKFYEREEVKDALALLSFMVNPRDEVAFRRMINKPARGAGPATVDRIVEEAYFGKSMDEALTGDLAEAARRLLPSLGAKAKAGIGAFLNAIDRGIAVLREAGPDRQGSAGPSGGTEDTPLPGTREKSAPSENGRGKKKKAGIQGLRAGEGLSLCLVQLITDSSIAEYHLSHDEISGNQRIANLQELANAASLYPGTEEGLLDFLEHIELDRSMEQNDAGDNAVTLITLHNTKGLEFRRVIITGLEQGVFPREDKKGDDLEEERRLFYVGVTRAMDELYLTSCAERRIFGRTMPVLPSIFLGEIDPQCIRTVSAGGGGASGPYRRSFGNYGAESYGARRAAQPGNGAFSREKTSSDGRWKTGNRVFHDDYGYGAVFDIRESDDGPLIHVRFETGKETRFLSLYQSSRFMRVGDD